MGAQFSSNIPILPTQISFCSCFRTPFLPNINRGLPFWVFGDHWRCAIQMPTPWLELVCSSFEWFCWFPQLPISFYISLPMYPLIGPLLHSINHHNIETGWYSIIFPTPIQTHVSNACGLSTMAVMYQILPHSGLPQHLPIHHSTPLSDKKPHPPTPTQHCISPFPNPPIGLFHHPHRMSCSNQS